MSLSRIYALLEGLLFYGAAASLVFLVGYLCVARRVWWRDLTGAAILVSALALAMLLNLEIVLMAIGASEYVDAVVTLVVLALICLGITFKIAALVWDWRRRP